MPSPSRSAEDAAATPARVVVLGIGNTICSDDGVGVHAAAMLREAYVIPEGMQIIDGGTAGMELLDPLADADLLLVLDAVHSQRAADGVLCLTGPEVPVFFRSKLSPHQVSICDVLASLEFSGHAPRDLVLIGVEPVSLDLGLTLMPEVAAKLPAMVTAAVAQLAVRGIVLQPRATGAVAALCCAPCVCEV